MLPEGDGRYRLKEHLLLRVFEDGGVVFDLDTRTCHEINRTAGRMMEHLNGEFSLEAVSDILGAEFGEQANTVKNDLINFVADLIERGWIDGRT